MYELKPLSIEAVPAALAKAERYRLLNEPWQAESICRDILAVEPDNQAALVMIVLALSDQFGHGIGTQEAHHTASRLHDAYSRAYYRGIVFERHAIALFRQGDFRAGSAVYPLIESALQRYEQAEAIRPPGNDDSVLRWNACARFLLRNPQLIPAVEIPEPVLLE
jgi:hypothetical protein